ncbi:MAG: gamma-glutamyltranspeptidase/glutathione hydrolase [Psychrobacter glaciei]|jgi:gamma-glutamyltranspeptidase/glutathione hydrolase
MLHHFYLAKSNMKHLVLAALTILALSACSPAESKHTGAVASAHPLATQAGIDILNAGGNAFDAAIATAAVLAVVEPYSAGMGGGGFWLLHNSESNSDVFVDAREKAPLKAHRDMYLDKEGNVIPKLSIDGPMAAAIPGQAAAFDHLAKKYGKLPLSQTLADSIRIAKNGFPVDEKYRKLAAYRATALHKYPAAAAVFLNGKKTLPELGDTIIQSNLSNTLQAIANSGFDGFYKGDVAKKMVADVAQAGGIWTLEDLAKYNIIEREPIIANYQGYKIVSAPPPSSGGIAIAQMLSMLNSLEPKLDWRSLNEADQTHLISETMRRAYFDRAHYLGDPDFVNVPQEKLLDPEYNAKLASTINMKKATDSKSLGSQVQILEGFHTTHLSILDKHGNRVSATLSVNLPFGSAFMSEATGVLMNNEMDDFSSKPGTPNAYGLVGNEANAIAPEKRPLSSMTPSYVESENSLAILGTPGGSRIITMVFLGMLEHIQDKPVVDWVSRPRFHHQYLPDVIQHEPNTFSEKIKKELIAKGHTLKDVARSYGNMHAILLDKNTNTVTAASDPRGVGKSTIQ